jgi:hypothetical protein
MIEQIKNKQMKNKYLKKFKIISKMDKPNEESQTNIR